jgi:ribA/ribD-fused uncharacterized protein
VPEIRFNSKTQGWSWLSNFSPFPVMDRNAVSWPTAEHAYQAAKTHDAAQREAIRKAGSAQEAKQLGKSVTLRGDWDEIKAKRMYDILWLKFDQHPTLKKRLLDTAGSTLIHEAPWDEFWGTGKDGTGKNVMGVILMQLRDLWLLTGT